MVQRHENNELEWGIEEQKSKNEQISNYHWHLIEAISERKKKILAMQTRSHSRNNVRTNSRNNISY